MKKFAKCMLWSAMMAVAVTAMFSGCSKDETTEPEPLSRDQEGLLYVVSGVAGQAGGAGNGGPAVDAFHYWPQDMIIVNDELYIVDWNNHCVRKIDQNGMITRYIGSGLLGDDTDGPKEKIDLNHPSNLTLGPDGKLYLSAWHNWKVKVIDMNTGQLTSPIGTSQGFLGDGGPAGQAKMDLPSSAVFDGDGNMYLCDQANQRVRKIDATGMITTFVGGANNGAKGFADGIGEDAQFNLPKGSDAAPGGRLSITADKSTIYMADTQNNRVRKIDIATREVTTVAGTGDAGYSGDGGPAVSAKLNNPTDVHVTNNNVIYIADEWNHAVRKIDANGNISTVAGDGTIGHSEDGTSLAEVKLHRPGGVYFHEATNTLYIADTFNQQVRMVINP